MPLGTEVGLGPGHIILDGVPAPSKGAQQPPLFRRCLLWPRLSILATAELLLPLPRMICNDRCLSVSNCLHVQVLLGSLLKEVLPHLRQLLPRKFRKKNGKLNWRGYAV